MAIISILVLLSYEQWGAFGTLLFAPALGAHPWVWWFAGVAKWAAVLLTMLSGMIYLWRNRQIYLREL